MTQQLHDTDQLHAAAEPVKKFFNKMQRAAMQVQAHDEYYICARGTGKSEGLDARFIIRNVWSMPGSTGGLISPSYVKAWGNTLPAICHALSAWGYKQDIHYVVGKRAPKSMNFRLPKRMPLADAWQNCIHFWNGTILVILSFSQSMSANSMSLDWLIGPEAKFLDYDKIKSEINPANRGNRQYFDYSPWHHSVLYTTDMPTSKRGRWILDKEQEMDPTHINFIRDMYREMKRHEATPTPTDYTKRVSRELRRDIDLARKFQRPINPQPGKEWEYTVMYGEYDIFDNMEVVGKDFIWQMYRDSPPLVWRSAFLNERIFKMENGFYSALDDHHFYTPADPSGIWHGTNLTNCLRDGDLDLTSPLHIAFDSNASISTACVAQVDTTTNQLTILKDFFVKTPQKLPDLVRAITDYYAAKLRRHVTIYYDHTFIWTTGVMTESYADTITRIFEQQSWAVTPVYIGQQPPHDFRHSTIDRALKGEPDLLLPRFNAHNTEILRMAMEQAGVRQGKNGFEKDKTPESRTDTPDAPDQYKTHVTDAFDTLFIGTNFFFREGTTLASSFTVL